MQKTLPLCHIDLFEVYDKMEVAHFGHLISFYSMIEIYTKKKEIDENFIAELVLHSLNDFNKYKLTYLNRENNFFSQS